MTEVAVSVFRPVVERWLAQFESMEDGFEVLAARGDLTADAWRRRFTEDEGRWFAGSTLPSELVDEFLTLAGLPHLYEVLAPVMSEGERWCGHCRSFVAVECFTVDRSRKDGLAAWCRFCKNKDTKARRDANRERERARDRERYRRLGPRRSKRNTAAYRSKPRSLPRRSDARMNTAQVTAAYRLYREGWSVMEIAESVYGRFGFSRAVACRNALTIAFRKEGWRLRDRREQQFAWRARRAA